MRAESGISLERVEWCRHCALVTNDDDAHRMPWPWWAPWALLAVILSCAATVAATLYDIW